MRLDKSAVAEFAGRIYNDAAIQEEQETQGRHGRSGGWDAQIILQPQAYPQRRQLTAAYLVFSYDAHFKDYRVLELELNA